MIENRAQYDALALSSEVETPFGKFFVSGKGYGGDLEGTTFNVTFSNSKGGEPVAIWSTRHGFETIEQNKCRHWDEGFQALDKSETALVSEMFADRIASPTRHALKSPKDLVRVAKVQLIKAGKLERETCTRCGGSGNYSYCESYGHKCFKCEGTGKQMPSAAVALKAFRKGD
ncbi:hypothetical protein [Rhizobium phage RHph_X2_26]|nr:hypothetical protein [Rhizobium phage RHph_X2_26]